MSIRSKRTSGKARSARAHDALSAVTIDADQTTGSSHLRHRIDLQTGMYRGENVLGKRANHKLPKTESTSTKTSDEK